MYKAERKSSWFNVSIINKSNDFGRDYGGYVFKNVKVQVFLVIMIANFWFFLAEFLIKIPNTDFYYKYPNPMKLSLCIATNSNVRIPIFLQPYGLNIVYLIQHNS